jgi:FdhD protein
VDKTVGAASLAKAELNNCLLVLTGRLTADIIVKAARARIPLVASLAAALDSGIALAKDLDLTLVGFARGKRLNVYSFPERILA